MKKLYFLLTILTVLSLSCSSVVPRVFARKTPHEKYADKVKNDPGGAAWLAASHKAFEHPYIIQLPYSHHGYFNNDTTRALGLQFQAKQGEQISFRLKKSAITGNNLYADLFKVNGTLTVPEYSANPEDSTFIYNVEETGTYLLRLQPELYQAAGYGLEIVNGPSLGFPVSGNKARTGSFWGASRDGGKRSHEGVDIFAPKLTPVVASADGFVTGVRDGGLGGKTVWLRVTGKNISLYYAHLDEQHVREGQYVKKGEVLGLVGNTGNAKHTPSHLHFGIYTSGGPVDPFPFINPDTKKATAVASKDLRVKLKPGKTLKNVDGKKIDPNTSMIPLAVNAKGYIAQLPDGKIIQASFSEVKTEKLPLNDVAVTP